VSASGATLRAMNVEFPLLVLKLGGFFKPRYLVIQYQLRGAANTPTVVYAQLFYTRSRAVKAVHAADARIRIRIGDYMIGKRKPAELIKLPTDTR
jgi:hypothetical protein